MSHWMTSGASRLRAKQNRTFGARGERAASEAADTLININAPISSVCGKRQRKRGTTATSAVQGITSITSPTHHPQSKLSEKDIAHSVSRKEMNYFGNNSRRITSMAGHQHAPPPDAAQLQEAARRLAAQPPSHSLSGDAGQDDTSIAAKGASRRGSLPAEHANMILNQQRALLLQQEANLLAAERYGANPLLDSTRSSLLGELQGGLGLSEMPVSTAATAGSGLDPIQMEIERLRLQAVQEEMILREQLREQILLRRQQEEAALQTMIARRQNEQDQHFLSQFHETDKIAALQERRLARAAADLKAKPQPLMAAALGVFWRQGDRANLPSSAQRNVSELDHKVLATRRPSRVDEGSVTADREDLAKLQRMHMKQEQALLGNVHDYRSSPAQRDMPQPSSASQKGIESASAESNGNEKRRVASVGPVSRNVKPKVGNKVEESGNASSEYSHAVVPDSHKYASEDIYLQARNVNPASQQRLEEQAHEMANKQHEVSSTKPTGSSLIQRAPLTVSRRVSDFREDFPQPVTMRNITPPEPAAKPPKLRYFNNGVEVDVNGVPVVSPSLDDENVKSSRPKKSKAQRTDSGTARAPKKSPSKHSKPNSAKARRSTTSTSTASKSSISALPALPRSYHLADLLSFVRAHIPELSSALATIENQHLVAASSSLHQQDNAAHSRAVDAVLSELYHIVEGGLVEGLPTEREVGSAKDDDQLRARTATCIGAIEIYKRRYTTGEASRRGSGNLLPLSSNTGPAEGGDIADSVKPLAQQGASVLAKQNGEQSSPTSASSSQAALPLRTCVHNTPRNSLANIDPKPASVSRGNKRQLGSYYPSGRTGTEKPQTQQSQVRDQPGRSDAGRNTMPRRISTMSEPGAMKYSSNKVQRQCTSMNSTATAESSTGPHSDLMGEIFGEEQRSTTKEIDTKPSNFTEDPSKIAQASVGELVQDSLKEREKTLSAASVLLGLVSGNKSSA